MADIKLVPIFKVHKIPYKFKKLEVLEFKEMVFGITRGSQLLTNSKKYPYAKLINIKNPKNAIVWFDDDTIDDKIKKSYTHNLNTLIKFYTNKYKNNYWSYDGTLNCIKDYNIISIINLHISNYKDDDNLNNNEIRESNTDNDLSNDIINETKCEVSNSLINEQEVKEINVEFKEELFFDKLSERDIAFLEKYGEVINFRNYNVEPIIGRDKEIKQIELAFISNMNPILIGLSGVGKTALVDELNYRIKHNLLKSNFFDNRLIYAVDPQILIADTMYSGTFEKRITDIISILKKYNGILFIDEIHKIFGTGLIRNNDNDLAKMLQGFIDRKEIKIIGTTTEEEYQQYFANKAINRRFEAIKVNEPNKTELYNILNKVFDEKLMEFELEFSNIDLKDKIINIIIKATTKSSGTYFDRYHNPFLAIEIINKACALAKYNNDNLNVSYFIESLNNNNRLYESIKNNAIKELDAIDIKQNVEINRRTLIKILK